MPKHTFWGITLDDQPYGSKVAFHFPQRQVQLSVSVTVDATSKITSASESQCAKTYHMRCHTWWLAVRFKSFTVPFGRHSCYVKNNTAIWIATCQDINFEISLFMNNLSEHATIKPIICLERACFQLSISFCCVFLRGFWAEIEQETYSVLPALLLRAHCQLYWVALDSMFSLSVSVTIDPT